jgi:hypothetical protein
MDSDQFDQIFPVLERIARGLENIPKAIEKLENTLIENASQSDNYTIKLTSEVQQAIEKINLLLPRPPLETTEDDNPTPSKKRHNEDDSSTPSKKRHDLSARDAAKEVLAKIKYYNGDAALATKNNKEGGAGRTKLTAAFKVMWEANQWSDPPSDFRKCFEETANRLIASGDWFYECHEGRISVAYDEKLGDNVIVLQRSQINGSWAKDPSLSLPIEEAFRLKFVQEWARRNQPKLPKAYQHLVPPEPTLVKM